MGWAVTQHTGEFDRGMDVDNLSSEALKPQQDFGQVAIGEHHISRVSIGIGDRVFLLQAGIKLAVIAGVFPDEEHGVKKQETVRVHFSGPSQQANSRQSQGDSVIPRSRLQATWQAESACLCDLTAVVCTAGFRAVQ